MCLAIERYIVVCHPFAYLQLSSRKVYLAVLCQYTYGIIVLSGATFQARFNPDGSCTSEYAFEGKVMDDFFYAYSYIWFITFYLNSLIIFSVMYGLVLRTLRKKLNESTTSKTYDKASTEMTKTAITVSVIFVVCLAFDSIYYILGYTGVTTYEVNTPLQKIAVFLVTLNSVANPFVYLILLPSYRLSYLKAFGCAKSKQDTITTSSSRETLGTNSTHSRM